jgi:hypothetical protein
MLDVTVSSIAASSGWIRPARLLSRHRPVPGREPRALIIWQRRGSLCPRPSCLGSRSARPGTGSIFTAENGFASVFTLPGSSGNQQTVVNPNSSVGEIPTIYNWHQTTATHLPCMSIFRPSGSSTFAKLRAARGRTGYPIPVQTGSRKYTPSNCSSCPVRWSRNPGSMSHNRNPSPSRCSCCSSQSHWLS